MTASRDTWTVRLAAALYLVSGVAALVYQVAWQRILALYTRMASPRMHIP